MQALVLDGQVMGALAEMAYAADPALIMESAGMPPDEWQARVLRRRPQRLLLNCARQAGKSKVVSAMAVDEILRGPALVLAVCPTERQSKLLIESTRSIYEAVAGKLQDNEQSTAHLKMPNCGEMWALPSKEGNVRGFSSVSLLIIDEAARVLDALYHAVRPMLAVSGGRLFCLSTPFGKRGFFHKEWTEGQDWEKVQIRADQVPRIPASFLAEEKRALPDSWYRQEYCCEFAETDGAVFSYDDVMKALSDDVVPLFQDLPVSAFSEVEPLFQ